MQKPTDATSKKNAKNSKLNSYKFSSISPLHRWKMTRTTKKHDCSLNLGSESMLPKMTNPTRWKMLKHVLRKLTLISIYHPESFKCFLSYPAILAERQKQVFEGGEYVIHPFSVLSLAWSSFMIFINLAHMIFSSLRVCLILEKSPVPALHPFDYVMLGLNLVCLLDVVFNFHLGFQEGHASNIVMRRRRVTLHYLCWWFYVDILSCLPTAFVFLVAGLKYYFLILPLCLPLLRIVKVFKVMRDLRIFLQLFTRSYVWHRLTIHITLFSLTIHMCACAIYIAPSSCYYIHGDIVHDYCGFLKVPKGGKIYDIPAEDRYKKAVFLSFASFFGIGFSTMSASRADETIIDAFIILHCSLFMVYTMVVFLKLYLTMYNSTMRYYELMSQVKKYMRHKQFPESLKKRVMAYYNYLYQERYFKEESALDCLSEQLRNEINLHTCHKLINKVALFEGVPASVVGAVLGCLRSEVYMPKDLVIRGGDVGNCMYFIAAGTVAVYSLKGAEVCHLEDGAHFGEVALLMKDSKRVATVVAIEITQVYRLDEANFREFIMSYHELYERVEALASQRMHETVLIDEAFRKVQRSTEGSVSPPNIGVFARPSAAQASGFRSPSQASGFRSPSQTAGFPPQSSSQRLNEQRALDASSQSQSQSGFSTTPRSSHSQTDDVNRPK